MYWQDEGIVLSGRRYGENSLLLQAFTAMRGRHGGLVKGGASRKARSLFQPGNRIQLVWRARLADQLGTFTAEPLQANAALVMDDPRRLAVLHAVCALLAEVLPERDPLDELYHRFGLLLGDIVDAPDCLGAYVRFELDLLAALGFGLDLAACAVTGGTDELIYVSPRSGRAVCRSAAGSYAARLLALPSFLVEARPATLSEALDGLALSGFFLGRHVFEPLGRSLPAAREALIDRLRRDLHLRR